jgi:hypothetical protein
MSAYKLQLLCAVSVVVLAAVGPLAVVRPASAQSTVSRDRVDALEAQINALQQELRDLKGKVNKAEQTAQKAYAANPPSPKSPSPAPTAPTAVAQNDAGEPAVSLRH